MIHHFPILLIILLSIHLYVYAQSTPSKQTHAHSSLGLPSKIPPTTQIQSTQLTFENPDQLDFVNNNELYDSKVSPKQKRQLQGLPGDVPPSFDWRQKIKFHVVNSLESCPNYWAYSTTAFFSALAQIQDPSLTQINFSQEYLIKCDKGNNNSCSSGFLNTAMDFVLSKGGLAEQQNVQETLSTNQSANICQDQPLYMLEQTKNVRLAYFNLGNQQKIKQLLFKNPLNIKICSKDLRKYYPSSSKEGKRLLKCNSQNTIADHSVLLVGYTQTQWIILNQWGPFWGINGFAYISRQPDEDCCIGSQIHTISPKSQKCPLSNCLTCINQTYCTKCSPKYYLTYNFGLLTQQCTKCAHENCESCLDYSGTCTNCLAGFSYFSDQKKCLLATISYCTFMSMDLCFECSPGFILSKNYLECYQNCPLKNCKACPNTLCTQCVAGFYVANYTDGSQSCQKNPCTVQNCRLCDKNGKCIECSDYYSLNYLQKCDPICNMEGCLICNEQESKCSLCASGKSFNFWTGLCQSHTFQNCFSFGYLQQLGLKCDQCRQNYIFNSNYTQCNQKCDVLNCIKCDPKDLTECSECQAGYFLKKVNGASQCQKNPCKAGITNCLLCDKIGNCIKCAATDFIFNSTSLKCERGCNVANCEKCDPERSDLCDTCNSGYSSLSDIYCYIKNDQKCVLWDQSSTSSPKACTYCQTNYQAVNGVCKPGCKDKFCDICEIETSHICKKCYDGYQLIPSAQGDYCKFNVPTMLFCDLISTNQTYCFKCSRGYFFLKQNQTWGCFKVNTTTPNCFAWDSTGKCLECNTFYKLNSSNLCEKVCKITGCLACSKNGMYCDQCDEGLSINVETKVCEVFNFSNCLNYQKGINSINVCVKCIPGTIFNKNLTRCYQECDTLNCAKCESDNKAICISCESGFYVKTINSVTECAPYLCEVGNCSACDDRGNCVACINANFELDTVNNQCRLLCKVTNCQQCTENLLVCLKCKDQYELYNNVCFLPSPEHCAVWRLGEDSTTRIGCSKCEPKYTLFFLVKEMEPKCKMNCTDSYCEVCKSDKDTCDKCIDGFERVLIDGNKYKCDKIVTRIPDCQLGSSNQSHCFYCKKYYFFNSTSKQCQPYKKNCKTNCQMCAPNSFYDSKCHCRQSFIFFTDTARCVSNPLSSSFCIQVQSGMNGSLCGDCVAGFQPSENRLYCEKYCDVENCQTCVKNNNTQCMNCMRGYYKKKWDFCKICDVENCAQCFEENSCLMCRDGFELIKNSSNLIVSCTKKVCPNNMIYRNQNCTCLTGTYQKDQKCQNCNTFTPNCTKCTNTTCDQCADQFYLSQNTCLACSSRCLKCTDLLNCQQCEPRYYFSSAKMRCIESALSSYEYLQDGQVISQCPNKCVNCSSNGKCLKCEPSYRADQSTGVCVECDKNCLSCQIDTQNGNAFVCTSCADNYILTNNSCVRCTENCLLCDKLTQECAKCKQGFYLSNQNKCVECKKNCSRCTSQFDCSQCLPGFALRQQQSECRQCLVDSISCNSSNLIESIIKCMDGFYLNVTNCRFCPSNCLQCNSSTNCTRCEVGYRLTNNLCYSDCKQGCFSCDPEDVTKCLMCFSGYVLDTKTYTCLADLSCNSNANCINCPLKHILTNNKCQKCKSPSKQCTRCSYQNPQLCVQCSLGYHLEPNNANQPCKLCPNGCKYCQSQSYCYVCNQGFFLVKSLDDSQFCQKCNSQCKTCQSFTGRCLTCVDGFQYIQAKDSCLTKERVGLWIKLNLNFSDIIDKFPIVKNALLTDILQNKQSSKDLIIKSIKQGSTIIDLEISTPQDQNTTSFISFISTKIASTNNLGGFAIIEYSKLSSVNDKQEVPENSPVVPVETSSSSKGALIAVSVIASVLFVILVILIISLVKKRKAQNSVNSSQRNVVSQGIESEKISTDQNIKEPQFAKRQLPSELSDQKDNNFSEKNRGLKGSERNSSVKSSKKQVSPFAKKKEILENMESAKQIQTDSEYFSDS